MFPLLLASPKALLLKKASAVHQSTLAKIETGREHASESMLARMRDSSERLNDAWSAALPESASLGGLVFETGPVRAKALYLGGFRASAARPYHPWYHPTLGFG